MRRFFVNQEDINDSDIIFRGQLAHHISHVLRLKVGEKVTATTGDGRVLVARLCEFGAESVRAAIISQSQEQRDTAIAVCLYQALPKGDKLEWIIQKGVELGMDSLTPVLTERCVVKLDQDKVVKKQSRWQKIAQEAASQSKRFNVPEINLPLTFAQLLQELPQDQLNILLWEDEKALRLKTLLNEQPIPTAINLIIGPEGGFSAQEVSLLKERNVYSVTLGKRILRTETAGMAALAMVLYHYGELG